MEKRLGYSLVRRNVPLSSFGWNGLDWVELGGELVVDADLSVSRQTVDKFTDVQKGDFLFLFGFFLRVVMKCDMRVV